MLCLVLCLLVPLFITDVSGAETSLRRLEGPTRYETALSIAREANPRAESLIVVSGRNFADALSGSALIEEHGPMVLANERSHVDAILKAFPNLKRVLILGGESAVSEEVEASFKNKGRSTRRIKGATRFETSALIAKEATSYGDYLLVNGYRFPDGLSASNLSINFSAPVLLTDGKTLTPEIREILQSSANAVGILGGEGVITEALEDELIKMGKDTYRYAGPTRYVTALTTLLEFEEIKGLIIASGENFPDGLTGSALVESKGYPIILTSRELESNVRDLIRQIRGQLDEVIILGSEGVISKSQEEEIRTMLEDDTPHTYKVEYYLEDKLVHTETIGVSDEATPPDITHLIPDGYYLKHWLYEVVSADLIVFEAVLKEYQEGDMTYTHQTTVKLSDGSEVVLIFRPEEAYAKGEFDKLNAHRVANGLKPLTWNEELYSMAIIRAADLSILFSHHRPDGTLVTEYVGVNGENVAKSSKSLYNVTHAFDLWKESPGHNRNMLNSNFKSGAIATCFVQGTDDVYHVTLFSYDE